MAVTINASTSAGLISTADTSGILQLQTASTTAVTVDASQNVSVGVTPSAWRSAYNVTYGERALEVTYSALVTQAGPSTILANNVYFNSSNQWIYKNAVANTNAGLYTIGSNGVHSWSVAPTGASGAVATFTQAMTLDASGNLGVGATSITPRDSGARTLELYGTSSGRAAIKFTNPTSGTGATDGMFLGYDENLNFAIVNNESGVITFGTSNTERARIDSSGNFMVGGTSTAPASGNVVGFASGSSGYISVSRSSGVSAEFNRIGSDGDNIVLRKAGTQVGSISVTASATAYNTSSDYRLKNTIAPMTGALEKVALLKPCTYKWNANGSDGEGFIAHELAEVCPDAVTGAKDAVDAEGNPQYQGIDTSFLVATLTAALQELDAKFEAYKASHP
jgi:hypothetical protein